MIFCKTKFLLVINFIPQIKFCWHSQLRFKSFLKNSRMKTKFTLFFCIFANSSSISPLRTMRCIISPSTQIFSTFSPSLSSPSPSPPSYLVPYAWKSYWTTLNPNLHFGSPNYELSFKFIFWSKPIGFPSKMMPCRLNYNLIYLGIGSFFKSFGTI